MSALRIEEAKNTNENIPTDNLEQNTSRILTNRSIQAASPPPRIPIQPEIRENVDLTLSKIFLYTSVTFSSVLVFTIIILIDVQNVNIAILCGILIWAIFYLYETYVIIKEQFKDKLVFVMNILNSILLVVSLIIMSFEVYKFEGANAYAVCAPLLMGSFTNLFNCMTSKTDCSTMFNVIEIILSFLRSFAILMILLKLEDRTTVIWASVLWYFYIKESL